MTMRIGIEAQRLYRPNKHGMDMVALESIKALRKIDPDNEYIVFTRPGEDQGCLKPGGNLEIVEIPAITYADWEQIQLPRAVAKHGVDLLHSTSNTAPVHVPVPTVVTVHDIIFLEQSLSTMKTASAYQRLGHVYRRWNVPHVMKHADRVITVSEFERNRIQDRIPGIAGKLDVVHNGVSERFFDFVPPWKRMEVRRRLGLPKEYVLFLGNTDPKKNTPNVIKAYAQYAASEPTPLPLVVADLPEERIDRVLEEIGLTHIKPHIKRLGYINPVDMPHLYGNATLFLYPSLRESFGLPIIEAMAASTPVITSTRASMPEVAGSAAMLVDPEQPKDIARMISILVSDVSLRNTLRQRGRDRARKFSWYAAADQLRSVYAEVAGNKSALRLVA